jgi:hypothetical protein
VVVSATDHEWLIDKSALVRLAGSSEPEQWAERIQRGLVRIATVTLLEVGYSARNAADLETGLNEPPISSMPVQYATPVTEDRAIEVLRLLAARGHHRAPSVPDFLIAAIAETAGLTVLHDDKDFDLIAQFTDQRVQRLT